MKSERKSILRGVVISGMIAGALPVMANSDNLFSYETMGSGSELRAELLEQYGSPIDAANSSATDYIVGEAKCGEGKCGEGKCGEKGKKETTKETKKESKKETKKSSAEGKTSEKTSEAKCGEAKCGEKSKKEGKKESKEKTSEAKCGENTCGGK